MTLTKIDKDFDDLSITVTAHLNAPVEKVWQLWADPRLLERWWGPPTHPATFQEHDMTLGGSAAYFMTGPEGETYHGWWEFTAIEPPRRIEFIDGFADKQGNRDPDMGSGAVTMTLTETDDGTQMEIRSVAASLEQMEQLLEMGAAEGMGQAVGQMDALLSGG